MSEGKTKLLIVDDSAVIRSVLTRELSKDPRINVLGAANDPYEARDMIVELKPDVITLDLEMPRMNGLEFISVLMKHYPLPIIVLSSLIEGRQGTALQALELGAIEVFAKPKADLTRGLEEIMSHLAEVIVQSSYVTIQPRSQPEAQSNTGVPQSAPATTSTTQLQTSTDKMIAIGASTGGTEAIRRVLMELPPTMPGIMIVQHMPETFTKSFAKRLNELCRLEVREAVDGEELRPGLALLAPGDRHLMLRRNGARFQAQVKKGPAVSRHRPSVDVLFQSVAEAAGKNAIGVIMTGMGADGAKGLLAMRQAGARTMAQDEATCVVYGMPREATLNGAAEVNLPLGEIPVNICKLV